MTRDRDGRELKVGDAVMVPGTVRGLPGDSQVVVEVEDVCAMDGRRSVCPASEVVKQAPADENPRPDPKTIRIGPNEPKRKVEVDDDGIVTFPADGNVEAAPDLTFEEKLRFLINRESKENESNTPDFILASYLNACLHTFTVAVQWREQWYGRASAPADQEKPNETVKACRHGIYLATQFCAVCWMDGRKFPPPSPEGQQGERHNCGKQPGACEFQCEPEPPAVEGEEGRLWDVTRKLHDKLCGCDKPAPCEGCDLIAALLTSERAALEKERDTLRETLRAVLGEIGGSFIVDYARKALASADAAEKGQ